MDPPPKKIDLSGTPHEIGFEHGKQLAVEIRRQIEVYDAMFKETSKLDWPAVQDLAKEYLQTIERLTPNIYIEMLGIAEGSKLDVLDIVALNCRSEIALGLFSDGCSSLGWKFGEHETVLAQNWDWTKKVKQNLVLMSIKQQDKPTIYMVTEAGIVGKIGFNSLSVGTCLNAVRARPTIASKLPIHVALRVCLNSISAAAAISELEALGGVASSQHILIADTNGPIGLELSPNGDVHLEPDSNGVVVHTNHFVENRFVDEHPWLSGSPIRLERLKKLTANLASSGENLEGKVLRQKVFSDTFNAPQAIRCTEDLSKPLATRSSTLFCIIMKLAKGVKPNAELVWGMPGSGYEGEVLNMPW